ncbi:hypothetical protein GPECTOR_12g559 [Gonium pectorale]|uniref:phytol kinase n=1 Tax=Gonium pectorale TaxID=33097 RepID=A0A150GP77_GONPE|nr:hypothetical protein GPECTOR_12g559 [Gonium pectorale]|eukprot:KXZ51595.1 hypothetical protein GPECTOR_12g559 [Gonium pectorale]
MHAAGRQLAALAGSPEAAAATAGQGGSELAAPADYAVALLELVYVIISTAARTCLGSHAPVALQLQEELAAALEGSQVLEHAGRALLLLLLHAKGAQLVDANLEYVALTANSSHLLVAYLQHSCFGRGAEDGGAGEPLGARLCRAASGRCTQHAALCLGLAVLCHADGGPAYGMPPELLAALPTDLPASASTRVMSSRAATQLKGMVGMLRLGKTAPPGRRAALAILYRVGWLAVDSARELTGAARGGSGGSAVGLAVPAPRRIIAAGDVLMVALDALECSAPFLRRPVGVPETDSVRAAEAAGWWRLAAAIVAEILPHAVAAVHAVTLGRIINLPEGRLLVRSGALPLPPEPPPEVAAALDGGLLRCLERLMRRAVLAPEGLEAATLRALGSPGGLWPYLAPLLAYGEPRQAAALVATLRKLLRTVFPRTMLAEYWIPQDRIGDHGVVQAVFDILRESLLLDAAGLAPGEDPSPASQQLLRLLSCAACEWLPALTRAILSPEPSEALSVGVPMSVLKWLQLLVACCAAQPGTPASSPPAHETEAGGEAAAEADGEAAAGDGCGGAAVEGGEAAAGYGGWRALLLEEVGAVPLLDAALKRHVPPPPGVDELRNIRSPRLRHLRCLVDSCCAVAAVYTGLGPPPPAADAALGTDCPTRQSAQEGAAAGTVGWAVREAEWATMGIASGGAAGPEGGTTAARSTPARPPLPWRPELLREAATQLRSFEEHETAANAEALAAYLERGDCGAYQAPMQEAWSLASALPPPAEARRMLPVRCANPTCANLEGDSEADLTLKGCAGCGAVGYCCRPCQLEHWRAGHKEACGKARGGGA